MAKHAHRTKLVLMAPDAGPEPLMFLRRNLVHREVPEVAVAWAGDQCIVIETHPEEARDILEHTFFGHLWAIEGSWTL